MKRENIKRFGFFLGVGLVLTTTGLYAQQSRPGGASRSSAGSSAGGSLYNYPSSTDIGQARVTYDPETRSVIVVADEETAAHITNMVRQLDRPAPQVLIKCVFMQATYDKGSDIGVQGTYSHTISSSPINAFNGTGTASTAFPLAATGGMYALLGNDLQITLSALANASKTEILSRPSILALNNQQATITIGQQVPLINGVTFDSLGNQHNSISYQNVGIILQVTPFITSDGMVEMIVQPQISDVSSSTVSFGGGGTTNSANITTAPIIDIRSADTVAVVPDGQTVVIGGLMQNQKVKTEQKVPILGDIPLLGLLFRHRTTDDAKQELLIFLTPHIVNRPTELAAQSENERNKTEMSRKNAFSEEELDRFLDKIPLAEPKTVTPQKEKNKTPGPATKHGKFMNLRGRHLYSLLGIIWALMLVWQVFEHLRVRQSARDELINRAKDISNTAGNVMHALRRFGVVPRDRLEPALKLLIKPGDVNSIALLNAAEEVVALVGEPIAADLKALVPSGAPYWSERSVTVMNLVELGTNQIVNAGTRPVPTVEHPSPVIVLNEPFRHGTNRPSGFSPRPPPGGEQPSAMEPHAPTPPDADLGTNQPPRRRSHRGEGEGRPPFGRPFWMSEPEYTAALQKQGVHSFVIVLPTTSMQASVTRDLWLRLFIVSLALLSVVGLGLAWRNFGKSAELELRLMRAAELNTRLKEMNFAAAGLAHETKNPLNIIRGLAQMISKREDSPPEIREKSRSIVDEADRVTAQLNDFINFSRPREVRRATVPLNSAVGEVVRALGHDLEDRSLKMHVAEHLPAIEADEQLLRQALFNLLLNATQAVERGGEIHISAERNGASEATLEIRDNGPGVPAENRTDIFKPYFTNTQKGTGLGLAVVQQIVLAHGWEIECVPNEPRGAVFRISHLRVMP